jgi:hypothetical protein
VTDSISWSLVLGMAWASRFIAYWGSGGFSHIDVITPAGMYRGSRSDVIKGVPPGYEDRPAHYETWARQTIYTLPVTAEQYRLYWEFSERQLHKPYASRGLMRSFGLNQHGKTDWRSQQAWWCSQEVMANCEYAGIGAPLARYVNSVEPGDCAMFFSGAGASHKTWVNGEPI